MNNNELTLEGVKQFYVNVEEEDWKFATLVDFYETLAISQSVIFVNNSLKVELLYDELHLAGYCVSATHEDMDENTREVIMEQFRSGKHERAHVTTDGLLARGIDGKYVSLVINYDLPTKPEDYLRRIGRSGRSRRNVVVINFVTDEDDGVLANIKKFYDVEIKELPANVGDLL